jgi:hypothetical protein
MKIYIFCIILLVIIVAVLSGCTDTIPPGWPPANNPVASPIITSISPADSAIGGYLDITINGSNFGTVADRCFVYFGTEQGIITSFSSTQIVLLRPETYGVTISTRVIVQLADDLAEQNYKIKRVVTPLAAFPGATITNSIASDNSGNVYAAFINARDTSGVYKVIRKISSNGIVSDYAVFPLTLTVGCMRVASNGTLYALMTGANGEFHSVASGGGSLNKLFGFLDNMLCFDIDQNGVIYAGGASGSNKTINIVPAGSTTVVKGPSYANNTIRSMRVFQNYVYVLAEGGMNAGVYRHQISGGTLGAQEQVFLWNTTGEYAASKFKDLTFSASGDMYIATDRNVDPILLVIYSTGTVTGMRPLYKNLITTASGGLTWTSNILFERVVPPTTSNDPPSITVIDMGNPGAPYYNR